ncbi:hypothetical protein B0H19DRAFT_1155869 [Mycena capillaripes]|nr:hypothetical protein B0H19DRAFT_1155869 [Mycena capillaripes]
MSLSPTSLETPVAGDASNLWEPSHAQETAVTGDGGPGQGTNLGYSENIDRLVGAINKHSESLRAELDGVKQAVEALKQQPQSPDKKIAFWTAYKTLADEFDKEFQEKYGADLDTSLIFAGLFSAVSSAFIIQIQPELQPDPNATTQALLVLLIQNLTDLPAAILPPGAAMPPSTTPPTMVVIAQTILYFSLFATLGAALLAVLAKQWLLHYNSAGERGTIEERGLERQRKVDGMRSWGFELVMQVFPLLLQFALLLFATALSIYLWTINHAIAATAITLTWLGCILYAMMIISAVASPDSPFQTSLSFLLKAILHKIPILRSLHRFPTLDKARGIFSRCSTVCTGAITQIVPLLPQFYTSKTHESISVPLLDPPYSLSKEASAVVWALQTSTNPGLVEIAAEIVPELQWPVSLDVRPALKRLDDTFRSCVHGWDIREEMMSRATACIRAFWILDMVTEDGQRTLNLWTYEWWRLFYRPPGDLDSILFWTHKPWPLNQNWRVPSITQWTLRFIAAQNPSEEMLTTILEHVDTADSQKSTFADFLFCLNSCFSPTVARDRSMLDKTQYTTLLIALLFENLLRRLTSVPPLDYSVANDIVIKVAQFADRVSFEAQRHTDRCTTAGYRFCALPGVSQMAMACALRLVRMTFSLRLKPRSTPDREFTWLSRILESAGCTSIGVDLKLMGDLWQAVFLFGSAARDTLSAGSIRALLSVLCIDNEDTMLDNWDKEVGRMAGFACGVLDSADHWFADEELGHILQKRSVWVNLGRTGSVNPFYVNLGEKLSREAEWKAIIAADLPGWLTQWPAFMESGVGLTDGHREHFRTVLSRVWDADETEAKEFGKELSLVMVFNALAKTWNQAQFTDLQAAAGVRHHTELLRSTILVAFSARFRDLSRAEVLVPSQRFQDMIMFRLGKALMLSGQSVKNQDSGMEQHLIAELSDFISGFASTVLGELRTPHQPQMWEDWKYLQRDWLSRLYALRCKFVHAAASPAVFVSDTRRAEDTS